MNRNLLISSREYNTRLKSASWDDNDTLRRLKNSHKTSFFFQDEITEAMQREWYGTYLDRQHDYMFIVETGSITVGCMAFRLRDGYIDLYNIIRDDDVHSGKMYEAMYIMLGFIVKYYGDYDIICDVIKGNPAVEWYKKCGFRIIKDDEYLVMGIDKDSIPIVDIEISER